MMKRLVLCTLFCCVFSFYGMAQQSALHDSIRSVIANSGNDSIRFNEYIRLFSYYSKSNLTLAAGFLDSAAIIADRQSSVYYKGTVLYNRAAYFTFKGKQDSALVCAKASYNLLKGSPFKKGLTKAIGNICSAMGQQNQKVILLQLEILQICSEIRDTSGIISAYISLSNNHTYLNQFDSALFYSEKAIVLSELQRNDLNISNSMKQLCSIYFEMGEFDEAAKQGFKALEYAIKTNNINNIIWLNITIGNIYYRQNNYPRSLEYYNVALAEISRSGIERSKSRVHVEKSSVYLAMQQYQAAETELQSALEIAEKLNNKYFRLAAYSGYFDLYDQTRQDLLALNYARMGSELAMELGVKTDAPYLINAMGISWLKLNQTDSASWYAELSYKLSKEIHDNQKTAAAALLLYEVRERQSRHEDALKYYIESNIIMDSLFSMEKSKIIAEIEKKYEASKKEEEISKLKSVVLVNQLELETQRSKLLLSGKDAEQRAIQLKLLGRQHQIGRLELLNQKTRNRLQEVNLKTQQSELLVSAKEMALRKSEIKNKELLFNFSIGGAALILAFGGVTFYRSRKRKEWEQKQALTEERLRISRELHDDMGSTLSSILIYSEVAKNRSQKRIDNDEALSKIGQASRELVDKMSDIVWSLNPENENMDQLKNRMVAFAAIMLTPNNMLFRFAASDELNTFKLSPDQKKNIFLIFKEAIHNIVKYAKCESVDINMMLHNGQMVLNISDDGNGFSHHANGNGMGGAGIRNMKARAAHIGAELKVHSNSGKGVDIELRMPA